MQRHMSRGYLPNYLQAIANEAAARLVALHRQNEGLASEREELEVRRE